jgi:hypothetical protein
MEAPDCASIDGITPDIGVPAPQNDLCATCPQNAFGSKVNEKTGKKSKACADSRRLAIVPAEDINNEDFGGPILLRVPQGSLAGLINFNAECRKVGVPYYAVVVELGFDVDSEFPMITFKPVAVVQDNKIASVIRDLRDGPVAESICFGNIGADLPVIGSNTPQRQALPPVEPEKSNVATMPTRGRGRPAKTTQPAQDAQETLDLQAQPEDAEKTEGEPEFAVGLGAAKATAQTAKPAQVAEPAKKLGSAETALGALLAGLPG